MPPPSPMLLSILLIALLSMAASSQRIGELSGDVDRLRNAAVERPVVVQTRASRIDCILNLRSFELCRNLLH
ncbi:unnamed protein product [Caenorhabditis bovis]|uniref:Uncharacterized protein n=1 Tax=Caenorhabditis bovis TaxID=2654633 RepID=A0A8S1EYF7_9PELO|nr:unnamed protein product [Caenorhabditis bovis]